MASCTPSADDLKAVLARVAQKALAVAEHRDPTIGLMDPAGFLASWVLGYLSRYDATAAEHCRASDAALERTRQGVGHAPV